MAEREKVNLWHLSAAVLSAPLVCLGVPLAIPSVRGWLLDSSEFVPRTECGTGWTTALASTAQLADTVIFCCYLVLSVTLFFWYQITAARLSRREAIAVAIWGAFTMACGLTHFMGRLMFVYPCYRFDALVRVYLAIASVAAVLHSPILLRIDTLLLRVDRWFRT